VKKDGPQSRQVQGHQVGVVSFKGVVVGEVTGSAGW
jgi:hypothetical protein